MCHGGTDDSQQSSHCAAIYKNVVMLLLRFERFWAPPEKQINQRCLISFQVTDTGHYMYMQHFKVYRALTSWSI